VLASLLCAATISKAATPHPPYFSCGYLFPSPASALCIFSHGIFPLCPRFLHRCESRSGTRRAGAERYVEHENRSPRVFGHSRVRLGLTLHGAVGRRGSGVLLVHHRICTCARRSRALSPLGGSTRCRLCSWCGENCCPHKCWKIPAPTVCRPDRRSSIVATTTGESRGVSSYLSVGT